MTATEREFCGFMAAIVRIMQPDLVVEAGTYKGHAAVTIGRAVKTYGGRLFSADPYDHGVQPDLDAEDLDCVNLYRGGFLEMIEPFGEIGFAFIDATDHSRLDGADLRWIHFEAVRAKMPSGGIICTHDTLANHAPWGDGEQGRSRERIAELAGLHFNHMKGLSVYQQP